MADNLSEGEYIASLGIEGVKTKEELVAHVAKLKQDAAAKADFESKWNTAHAELETIKPAYETLKATPPIAPYKRDAAKWLDQLPENLDEQQIETAWQFRKVEPDKLKPEEVVKVVALIKTPGLRPEHVDADFNSKYAAPAITEDDSEEEKQTKTQQKLLREANLINAANADREYLKTFKMNTVTTKADTAKQEFEAKKNELTTFWSGRAPVVLDNLRTIKGKTALILPGGKGEVQETVDYEFTVPEQDFGNFKTEMAQRAIQGLVPNTQEGENNLIGFAGDRLKVMYHDKILEAQQVAANNKFVDFLMREFNVKLPPKQPGTGSGGSGAQLTSEQERERAIFKKEGEKHRR